MLQLVTQTPEDKIMVKYDSIKRDRKDNSKVFPLPESKTLHFVFDKRILCKQGITLPYGFNPE